MKARLWATSLALLIFASVPAGVAFAAPPTAEETALEHLRKRFTEGIEFERDARWSEALAAFREVGQSKMTPQVRYHIALAEEQVGQIASALADYKGALDTAVREGATASDVQKNAPPRIADLEGRVPSITIRASAGEEVSIDGVVVPVDQFEQRRLVDPGLRKVTVKRGVETRLVQSVNLSEGQHQIVTVEPADKPRLAPPPQLPGNDDVTVEPGDKMPAIIVGSVGVATSITTFVLLGLGQASINEVIDSCDDPDGFTGCDPNLEATADEGANLQYGAIGLGVASVALFATAAALWLTIGEDQLVQKTNQPSTSLQVGPTGVRVVGSF